MRVLAIVVRIIRQFFRDKRTLALMIVAPMFVLLLMDLVFNGEEYKPAIAVSEHVPEAVVDKLKEAGAKVKELSVKQARKQLDDQDIDAWLDMNGSAPHVTLEGSDPTANQAVMAAVQQAFQSLAPKPPFQLKTTYWHGSSDMASFDYFGPVLIGFFVFFFVFLIAGVSVFARADERDARAADGDAAQALGNGRRLHDRVRIVYDDSSKLNFMVCH